MGSTARWRMLAVSGAALMTASTVAACGSDDGMQINVYYAPEENFQSVIDRCNEEANGRYEIVYRKLPRDADGQREQMVRRLAAGDTDLDILGLDVTWVPEFAEAKWLEEWTGQDKQQAEQDVLEGPLTTAEWNGKLYAATKNTNVQLLWYDDTVTPTPPKTWREMIDMAKQLKGEGKPYQVLFTGAQYEGLVVTYNTLVASYGGKILSDDGKSVVMDAGAVDALKLLKEVSSSGITDPSLTNAQEQQVQQGFESPDSKAAFELNWPYVYAAMQDGNPDRAKNFKWARYPGIDGPGRVTIGGYNLAVSAYSEHKPESFEAALCLRSAESQRYSAINDGVPPTIESVYAGDDKEFVEAYPMWETIVEELQDAAVRPLTVVYQNLSTITSKVLSPPQDIDPESTAAELRDQLQKALESKGVLP
ncbi:ABC transporter substrate-binding protein [Actinophytocola algeriensis]|uniref:Multiple sugar transport system substrate-binding protein n=1 Tax=Actinophytocola algeriensis TaxID=1768010 RepID=A0A7W7QEC3_9PSEU|nr:ABC transporter substrate-binding protein [Actinophytocola algeriensis]MBB4912010.1 multiple sugar transport system substrate-binding protein [Actinophytocola algeriensis]MBE1477498.1 multiple sugar transport system substrate-binding protein [Actinophytocola algeriensis]